MKRKLHIALFIAGAGLALSSCESLLDQNPAEYVSDKAIITDLSSAKAALNGAYHQLGATNYYGGTIFVAAINLSGDNVTWTGSLNYYYDYNTHRYSAENQLLSNSWSGIYAAVNQANQVIDKTLVLDNISDDEKARITGEATVIRSLAFFDLARTWGSVPLVREATSSPTQFDGVKQTKEQDVYKEVIEDILSVYDGLSESSDRVHISKATADALLARVYLYSEEWEKAELHAAKLIDNGSYELIDYPVFFQEKRSEERRVGQEC